MEFHLTSSGPAPDWDEPLMRAFAEISAPIQATSSLVIGIADEEGAVYRIVRTSGLYETVKLFESARKLGFAISDGRPTDGQATHRVLRRATTLHD